MKAVEAGPDFPLQGRLDLGLGIVPSPHWLAGHGGFEPANGFCFVEAKPEGFTTPLDFTPTNRMLTPFRQILTVTRQGTTSAFAETG